MNDDKVFNWMFLGCVILRLAWMAFLIWVGVTVVNWLVTK